MSANDQLPVRLTGQPPKRMPMLAHLKPHGGVLRSIVKLEDLLARIPEADTVPRARVQTQLDQLNGIVVEFERKYGRWAIPGVHFTAPPGAPAFAPTVPALPQRAAPPVPIASRPTAATPTPSMPYASLLDPIGTPPQSARGGLNKSTFSQVTADTYTTGRTDPAKIPQVAVAANVTGVSGDQTRIPQVSAGSVKTVILWKTIVNDDDPRADVQQTQEPFTAICELVKTCDPDRRAYYQSIRPATFRDFRNVQVSDNLQYKHDNGKVGPYRYGATPDAELWLCFATFHTFEVCPHGARCRYCHLTLTVHELIWISRSMQGRRYVEDTYFKYWNAKGGKQPVQQARALPVPVSKPVPQPAAQNARMQQGSAREHAHVADTGEQTNATRTKRKADDAEWSWSKRQRK